MRRPVKNLFVSGIESERVYCVFQRRKESNFRQKSSNFTSGGIMKGTILLSFVAFCGIFELAQGTSCTAATNKTCKKTLFMKGSCTNDICDCVEGYVPGTYGCQKKQKATISTDPDHFNGFIAQNNVLKLKCSGEAQYVWYKDGNVIQNENTDELTVTESSIGAYRCTSKSLGHESEQSEQVDVTTQAMDPEVKGMPSMAKVGAQVTLTCADVPATNTAFEWKKDGTAINGQTNPTYSHTVEDPPKPITCVIDSKESPPVTTTIATAVTDVVIVPATPIKLLIGETIILKCTAPDFGLESSHTYAWKHNGSPDTEATNEYTLLADDQSKDGTYTCSIDSASSSPVTVTISSNMAKDSIKVSSNPPIKEGYTSLECGYKTKNSATAVSFKWFMGNKELPGVTDSHLQINGEFKDGDYECAVTSEDGTVTNDATGNLEGVDIDSPQVTVSVENTPTTYGLGQEYTLTCESGDVYTPGQTYKWSLDDAAQAGETSKTFKYKATATNTEVKCEINFNSKLKSGTTDIIGKNIISIDIAINGQNAPSTLNPVTGGKVKLMCNAVLSTTAQNPTYKWTYAGNTVGTNKEVEITVEQTSKNLICEVKVGNEAISDTIAIDGQDASSFTPATPAITGVTEPIKGSKMTLYCISVSYAEGATIEWKKDSTVLPETSFKYEVSSVTDAVQGSYTCKITISTKESQASAGLIVTPKADEVSCTYIGDCIQPNFDSSVCDNGKCKCKTGFVYKAQACTTSGAGEILGSMMVVVIAGLLQKLL